MDRIPEPELMDDEAQALAYAGADFEGPNSAFCRFVEQRAEALPADARVLDLGCGPGDITLRLATAHARWRVDGVDGAPPMLKLAQALATRTGAGDRVRWVCARLPCSDLEQSAYDLVVSNSLLHHLPDPSILWDSIDRAGKRGAGVVVMDLARPESEERARQLVEQYSGGEPTLLKTDFFHSLRAAYRPAEVRDQFERLSLGGLHVQLVSDRHLLVWGHLA